MKTRLALSLILSWAALCALNAAEPNYQWRQTEDSLGLADGERLLWQLHFKKDEGKPYFHPIQLTDGTCLTALRPADHRWHRGLWWSWKLINGLNYWEEDQKGQSPGITELVKVATEPRPDRSARIQMELSYHPPGQSPVLTEKRVLEVSAPDAEGQYTIDWDSHFTAGPVDLTFDRTPPARWAGGYAGLSLRLAPEHKGWTFRSSEGTVGATNIYGHNARWLDFSEKGGVAIFDSPRNPRHPTWWYPNQSMPWCTPAFLFHEPYSLAAGKTLRLRYRVLMHTAALTPAAIEERWQAWSAATQARRLLVFTRNGLTLDGKAGYVHDNIAASVAALRELGRERGWIVEDSADPALFTPENLRRYAAVVFANSNNESLATEAQKTALQRYIHEGGGFVGIHSACGSMRNWPWFWSMLGGTFERHPRLQPFTIRVVDRQHPSTSFLGETWQWEDEFYYLKNMTAGLRVLLAGDLTTLDDPAKPTDRATQPLAWCHEFEGGRCWFTALGHKKEHYADPAFRRHLLGGLLWAMDEPVPADEKK